MTIGRLPDRERPEPEALLADRYLDDLLSAAERRVAAVPVDAALDPGLREAAAVLRRSLVRVHPSFRFEERLSARLSELAAAHASPMAAGAGGSIVRLDRPPAIVAAADPLLGAILAGGLDPADDAVLDADAAPDADWRSAGVPRPLIVGGAITSAAISLVGVAWVAWRASRPGSRPAISPMARAARAARARRPVDAAVIASGLGGPA